MQTKPCSPLHFAFCILHFELLPRDINSAVAAAKAQRAAALPDASSQVSALVVIVVVPAGRDFVNAARVNTAIAGVRVDLGIQIGRQPDRDRTVAGIDAPFGLQHAAVADVELHAAIAGPDIERLESSGDLDGAVAGISLDTAGRLGDFDRPVTGTGAEIALDAPCLDAPIAGVECDRAGQTVGFDGTVTRASLDGQFFWSRDDEAHRRRLPGPDVNGVLALAGTGRLDDNPIAVLGCVDDQ